MPQSEAVCGPDSAPGYPPPDEGCNIQIPPRQAAAVSPRPSPTAPWQRNILFLEIFAGEGVLTATLKGMGLPTIPPDEFVWRARISATEER